MDSSMLASLLVHFGGPPLRGLRLRFVGSGVRHLRFLAVFGCGIRLGLCICAFPIFDFRSLAFRTVDFHYLVISVLGVVRIPTCFIFGSLGHLAFYECATSVTFDLSDLMLSYFLGYVSV